MDISKEGNICIFLHFRVLGVCIDCFSVMEQEEEKEEQEFGGNNALAPLCIAFNWSLPASPLKIFSFLAALLFFGGSSFLNEQAPPAASTARETVVVKLGNKSCWSLGTQGGRG